MSLREKAAEKARPETVPASSVPPGTPERTAPPAAVEPLPEVNIPAPGEGGPEKVPVHVAWSRVMETVRFAAKDSHNKEGGNYFYRSVDQSLNLFGPACRLHGVLVIPFNVQASYRDTKTSRGGSTRECTVVVTYRIYGPEGDFLEAQAAGESLDWSDKGSAKAQAVALRTLLYHAGLVPTQDPDPDAQNIERGEADIRSAASYVEEIADPKTTRARLLQIKYEIKQSRQADVLVENEVGDEEPIGKMIDRLGLERFGG